MADFQHARELATALLAELSSLRRDAPEDAELLGAEQAAQACAASLGVGGTEDARPEDGAGQQDGLFIPPHPNVAPDKRAIHD
jgi:hypothetical protein